MGGEGSYRRQECKQHWVGGRRSRRGNQRQHTSEKLHSRRKKRRGGGTGGPSGMGEKRVVGPRGQEVQASTRD